MQAGPTTDAARGGECTQTMVLAEPLEDQLVEWLRNFRPVSELRSVVLDAIRAAACDRAGDEPDRRRDRSPASKISRLWAT